MSFTILKNRSDFVRMNKNAQRWTSKTVVVQALSHDDNGDNECDTVSTQTLSKQELIRLGFTVTKRVDKRAVVRNRIKRRLREAARLTLLEQAKYGYDYVLIGRAETADCDFRVLQKDLRWCLKRLGCLQDEIGGIKSDKASI